MNLPKNCSSVAHSLAIFVAILCCSLPARSATLLVYNNNDTGAGSLRQAIADNRALGGGSTVVFSNIVTGTITLLASELLITNDITIIGPGADLLTISGNNARRVFNLANANVTISGLKIAFGRTNILGGAGVYAQGGALVLNSCIVISNAVMSDNYGGGVRATGSLTATNTTFAYNSTAAGFMGGVSALGGAIFCGGPLTLVNCALLQNRADNSGGAVACSGAASLILNSTVYGNSAGAYGGGINSSGNLAIKSCTITKNSCNIYGGGVNQGAGTATVHNSIIAGNTNGPPNAGWDCQGTFISGGYNLIGAGNGSTGWGALGDQVGTTNSRINPLLLPPANNGGPTFTARPLPGSPAIDQGNSFGLATDQRGRARPFDISGTPNGTGGDASDIGALELSPAILTVINTNDSGPGSLRQTIADATLDGDTILFASNVVGTIKLTTGVLGIDKALNIAGPGARTLRIDGNTSTHLFEVLAGEVTISGLTLANGRHVGSSGNTEQNGSEARGGGVFNQTTLAISDCILSNNAVIGGAGGPTDAGFAGGGGNGLGGAIANIATLTMTNCFLVGNSATGGAGGIASGGGFEGNGGQAYGGAIYTVGPLTLVRCALASNRAQGGTGGGGDGGASGGGLYNELDVTLLTCTVASNSAAGTLFDFGGGIYHGGNSLTIVGSTIAGNAADYGGGLNLNSSATLSDSILAYNQAGNGPDCSGSIVSGDYNFIQSTNDTELAGNTVYTVLNQNPQLGPLQDNGGLAPTMAPLAGSPVIDRGKSFGLVTDQRGAPRPFNFPIIADAGGGGDGSDIGAFESGSPTLKMSRTSGGAVVAWPAYYGNFALQSTTNVTASGSWSAAGLPALSGADYVVTNSPVIGNQFFRLKGK